MTDSKTTRICNQCYTEKSLELFKSLVKNKDKLVKGCVDCRIKQRDYQRKRREAKGPIKKKLTPEEKMERRKLYMNAYRLANKDKYAEYHRRWRRKKTAE